MVQVAEFQQSRVVIDDRYSSLLISTFYGKVDVEAAKWHIVNQNRLIAEAAKRGRNTITVNDSTHSERPDADARKFWAESMGHTPPEVQRATLGTFVVVSSAVIRGALTAIAWLSPQAREIETFPSMARALNEARGRIDAAGLTPPDVDPTAYEVPQVAACGTG